MMKTSVPLSPRAALFIGAALVSTPAWAQETPAPQQVTPPPIVAPAPAPAPAPTAQRPIVIQPAAPVVQSVPSIEEQQRSGQTAPRAAAPERRTTSTTTRQTRTVTQRATAPARAPAAAAPAPAPAAPAAQPAQQAPAPVAQAPAPVAQPQPAPVAEQPAPGVTETTTTAARTPVAAWPWLLGGLLVVIAGLAVFLLSRRRRDAAVYDEAPVTTVADTPVAPARPAPIPVAEPARPAPAIEPAAPAFAAPRFEPEVAAVAASAVGTAEEAEIAEPAKEDLAGIVDAPAPVSRRPWLELGLRPVRAGTTHDEEAVVDIELTVGNSGDTPARDVRISTFMLTEASDTDMERLLTAHRGDTAVEPMTIEPGEGARIDAHLAAPKPEDMGRSFNPVVVAEARYTLPDGREGRTAAAFRVGTAREVEGVGPLTATRPHVTETVDAELFGEPEHA